MNGTLQNIINTDDDSPKDQNLSTVLSPHLKHKLIGKIIMPCATISLLSDFTLNTMSRYSNTTAIPGGRCPRVYGVSPLHAPYSHV